MLNFGGVISWYVYWLDLSRLCHFTSKEGTTWRLSCPIATKLINGFRKAIRGAQLGPLLGLRRLKMCQHNSPWGRVSTKDRNQYLKSNHFELPVKVTLIVGIEMLLFTIHSRMMPFSFSPNYLPAVPLMIRNPPQLPTWMSQEVSKRLVSGLYPLIYPIYK